MAAATGLAARSSRQRRAASWIRRKSWLAVFLTYSSSPALASHIGLPTTPGTRTDLPGGIEGYLVYTPDISRPGEEWTGWIDVRHPSLDGPRDTGCLYDISSGCAFDRSDRFVQVRSNLLVDSNGNIGPDDRVNDFHFANKSYMLQAGVSVLETRLRAAPANQVVFGFDFPLDDAEERRIMDRFNSSGPLIETYYAGSFDDPTTLAETFHPSSISGVRNEAIFMGNARTTPARVANESNDVFAHELYHFLSDARAIHFERADDRAHSTDRGNIVFPTANHPAHVNEIGPRPAERVPGLVDITSSQVFTSGGIGQPNAGIFGDPDVLPWFPASQRGDVHAAGDRLDWDFVADHRMFPYPVDHDDNGLTPNVNVSYGLENLGGQADNHAALDFMVWGVGRTTEPLHPQPANNLGHDHTGLGDPPHFDDYPLDFFDTVDVFSLSTRYSDSDLNPFGLKDALYTALDYDLLFVGASPTQTAPGILLEIFEEGWTTATAVDDYVARWRSPFPATRVLVKAHHFGSEDGHNHYHDGTAQIDAIVASDSTVPEPATLALVGSAIVYYALRRRRQRRSGRQQA